MNILRHEMSNIFLKSLWRSLKEPMSIIKSNFFMTSKFAGTTIETIVIAISKKILNL